MSRKKRRRDESPPVRFELQASPSTPANVIGPTVNFNTAVQFNAGAQFPSPEALARLKEIDPAFPPALMEELKIEGAHRRAMETAAQRSGIERTRMLSLSVIFGQAGGLVLGLALIAGAVLVVYFTRDTSAATAGAIGGSGMGFLGMATLIWGPQRSAVGDAVKATNPPPGKSSN